MKTKVLLTACLLASSCTLIAQEQQRLPFLEPADTLHKGRFWTTVGTGTVIYASFSVGLYQAWYKDYELTRFHTFNDWGEWQHMDKVGHAFTAYVESNLSFSGAMWTGMRRRNAMWTAAGVGMLLQSTVEFMDGFSEKWGFSWGDMAFNAAGASVFVAQEMLWQDQRIKFKVSNTSPDYATSPILAKNGLSSMSLQQRANELYGSSFAETFLKDYNGQTIWLSANIASFIRERPMWLPAWLNVSVGYGAENMFGGYNNQWTDEAGNRYELDTQAYPRYQQFYLGLDVDLSRIPTRKRGLRLLLGTLNWIKIPSPTLEWNTNGQWRFHALRW
ncbi:MAG TPA: DUF2279 domain-containing protein [Saprospiraceae bacterium]|nr:DUF2279 domain-containing protein [Saprospiraceae bacterium]HMQ82317.1 DUF2279 domain-containing protein [Saprospiraceae bacterium]